MVADASSLLESDPCGPCPIEIDSDAEQQLAGINVEMRTYGIEVANQCPQLRLIAKATVAEPAAQRPVGDSSGSSGDVSKELLSATGGALTRATTQVEGKASGHKRKQFWSMEDFGDPYVELQDDSTVAETVPGKFRRLGGWKPPDTVEDPREKGVEAPSGCTTSSWSSSSHGIWYRRPAPVADEPSGSFESYPYIHDAALAPREVSTSGATSGEPAQCQYCLL